MEDRESLFKDIIAEQDNKPSRAVIKDFLRKIRTALKTHTGINEIIVSISSNDPEFGAIDLRAQQKRVHTVLADAFPELVVLVWCEFRWYGLSCCGLPPRYQLYASLSSQ